MYPCSSATWLPTLNLRFTLKYMKSPGVVLSPVLSRWSPPAAWWCKRSFWVQCILGFYDDQSVSPWDSQAWLYLCLTFDDSNFLVFFSSVWLVGPLVWRPRAHFHSVYCLKLDMDTCMSMCNLQPPFSPSLTFDALLHCLNFVVVMSFFHVPDYSLGYFVILVFIPSTIYSSVCYQWLVSSRFVSFCSFFSGLYISLHFHWTWSATSASFISMYYTGVQV